MKIRNTKTGAEYSSSTLVDNSAFGDFYDPDNQVYGEYGDIEITFDSGEWEEVKEEQGDGWHDLRKNPNDLPPYQQRVIVYDGVRTYSTFRSENKNSIKDSNDFLYEFLIGPFKDIIAWIEFPQFKKD